MTDRAQLAFPTYGAPSRLTDVQPQLQWRRVVETDVVDGQLVTKVIQDYTPEPLGTQHGETELVNGHIPPGQDTSSLSAIGHTTYNCAPCARPFQDVALLKAHFKTLHNVDKAEALLTFDNIREIMREALKEEYTNANPFGDRVYVWIADLAQDWVVYEVGGGYWKSSYVMTDGGAVTFGDRSQVIPRMTYMPLVDNDDDDA